MTEQFDPSLMLPISGVNVAQDIRSEAQDRPVKSYPLEWRQGVVTDVDLPGGRLTLTLGGDTTEIPTVTHMSNYRPKVGDTVQVLVQGPDMYVIDRISNLGPSVISSAKSATTLESDFTLSTSWVPLANGPSLSGIEVSPSGRLLVHVSSLSWAMASAEGALMSPILFHDTEDFIVYPSVPGAQITYIATANAAVAASKVVLYTGLPAGVYTASSYYACFFGQGAEFTNRHIWALPL